MRAVALMQADRTTRDGALFLAHGTIEKLDEIPAFLARIRRGRPASPELVRETQRRYALIGKSPLLEVTEQQAAAVGAALGIPAMVGMRLSEPSILSALRRAAALGLERLVVVPLAPFSVHVYQGAAEAERRELLALGEQVPALLAVSSFGTHPALIQAQAELIRKRLSPGAALVLTAHSLPTAVVRAGDPYGDLVAASAQAIGDALGVPYELAFQSQGADGGDWLGPTLRSALEGARERGVTKVVVAPFGFMAEHVETLYDLDVEARAQCAELGLELERVPALGVAAGLIEALSDIASRGLS